MKRYWRCFICNDIHVGIRPPEVCPTCKVRNAYVEITAAEAKIMAGTIATAVPALAMGPAEFRAAIEALAAANDFRISPDADKVRLLLEGIFANEARHGLKYCPCRLISKDPAEDLKLVCPCNFPAHDTWREAGECWCGLFVRR
jgi:ferredoxin-thioredoxin reductase catalytic chain